MPLNYKILTLLGIFLSTTALAEIIGPGVIWRVGVANNYSQNSVIVIDKTNTICWNTGDFSSVSRFIKPKSNPTLVSQEDNNYLSCWGKSYKQLAFKINNHPVLLRSDYNNDVIEIFVDNARQFYIGGNGPSEAEVKVSMTIWYDGTVSFH